MSISTRLENRLRRRRQSTEGEEPLEEFGTGWLTDIVRGQDTKRENARMRPGYTHASALLNFCPRAFRIVAEEGSTPTESVSSGMRIIWAIGRSLEHHVRKQFIAAHKHAAYGHWQCACGKTKFEGRGRDVTCPHCNGTADIYGEYTLFDHELKIVGNPDLLIWTEGKLRVVEIKSMNKKEFDGLTAPKPDHVFQMNMYQRLLGDQAMRTNILLYVKKDYDFKSPYKEFHINSRAQSGPINASRNAVAELRAHESAGTLPDRLGACNSPQSPYAKNCAVCVSCFNRTD